MECVAEQLRATLLDAGRGELLERTRALGSRWRELAALTSGRARLASDLLDWLTNTQQLHLDLDYLSELVCARLAALSDGRTPVDASDDSVSYYRALIDDKRVAADESLAHVDLFGQALLKQLRSPDVRCPLLFLFYLITRDK